MSRTCTETPKSDHPRDYRSFLQLRFGLPFNARRPQLLALVNNASELNFKYKVMSEKVESFACREARRARFEKEEGKIDGD